MSTLAPSLPTTANSILNSLTCAEYERLAIYLEPVEMRLGEVLCRPEQPITHVYFPSRGTISLVSTFEDGGSVEVGMVGNEGMFGVCVFLGTISTPLLAQVQLAGDGLRMPADVLKSEFNKHGMLHDLLLRYTQAFITQVALTAACNRAHHINGRLSKWLLMCQDRSQSKDLGLTHEFIATMLGTRRAGVSEAAAQLRDAGVINYNRGRITILDRHRLEAESCECYPMLKQEFTRLVGSNVLA
ncbi:MAG TPA: Crp/Fnr family transcriptional regulator [Pyrinomonadaceae bacterium]|nr:Crp/Fnr family transcriptional regulator [Pyrinomonadaceae bacterium]